MNYLSNCACLCWCIYLQSSTWFIGSIVSRPKISWPGLLSLVVWYVDRIAKADSDRITINGTASSMYVYCKLYVRTRFPITWCIIYMILFACGFHGEAGLVLIPYLSSIKIFLNSWLRNYPPRSYVISTGHGFRTSPVVSTKFTIVIAFLSWYFVTSNHPVTGSIIVMAFRIKWYFPFLRIL